MDPSKRCRATSNRTGEQCARARVPGSTVCSTHGGSTPQVRAAAERRVQEQQAVEVARRRVSADDLARFSDPISALEFCVGYSHALAVRLAGLVDELPDDRLRYTAKNGEHLRGEVVAAQKALDQLRAVSVDALKLGIDARRPRMQQETADLLDHALNLALQEAGIGWDRMEAARKMFGKHMNQLITERRAASQ
jgi:hypothetical protein